MTRNTSASFRLHPSSFRLVLLEPYLTGSHKDWAQEYARYSTHSVSILGLPGRFWKWRMHGGAVTLAQQFNALPAPPDLILASDMLDLTTFLALTRPRSAHIPVALYFHENQLTYPWSPTDRDVQAQRDSHYGFINYASALAADALFFNSPYHLNSFFEALPKFLKHFPDFNELDNVDALRHKASVLPLGLDLRRFNQFRVSDSKFKNRKPKTGNPKLILWNHRWEYDKNPADFFSALYALAERGLDFQVVIMGENFRNSPAEFDVARERLADRILHVGYAKSFDNYAAWLWRSDILPVTSRHDFFGVSVAQAIYCGCYPLLPHRLAYPDLLPPEFHAQHFYHSQGELIEKLSYLLQTPSTPSAALAQAVARFDWQKMAPLYDQTFQNLRPNIATLDGFELSANK